MKSKDNAEALKLLNLLSSWRPKGQLIYRLRELGIQWAPINAIVGNSCALAGRWAKRHGKVWPL